MLALCGGAVVWRTYCCCKEGRLWLESFRGSLVFLSVPGWSPGQLCQEPQIRARYHHQQQKSLRSQKVVNYWKCLALKSTPQVSSLIEMSLKQNSTSGGKKWKSILVRKQIINIFYRIHGEEGRTEPSDFSSGKITNCLLQSMADVIKRYLCVSFSDFRWSFLMRWRQTAARTRRARGRGTTR